jgi:hypothetical protein
VMLFSALDGCGSLFDSLHFNIPNFGGSTPDASALNRARGIGASWFRRLQTNVGMAAGDCWTTHTRCWSGFGALIRWPPEANVCVGLCHSLQVVPPLKQLCGQHRDWVTSFDRMANLAQRLRFAAAKFGAIRSCVFAFPLRQHTVRAFVGESLPSR